ncbi:repetitive organellar protein-like [Leptopilina boulardi]|uniref:repetitive organellar protein-like n=1 Tax=Leptopilina boulardi TaxID=63433 RepID=UPI0021F52CA1|nr:repetitive organellar protein-like [Leptopilina boulardi]
MQFFKATSLRSHRHSHHAHLSSINLSDPDDIDNGTLNDFNDDNDNSRNSNLNDDSNSNGNNDLNSDDSDNSNSVDNDDSYNTDLNDDSDDSNISNIDDEENMNNEIVDLNHHDLQKTTLGLMLLSMRAQCQVTNDVVLNVIQGLDAVVKRYVHDSLLKTKKVLSDAGVCDISDYIDIDQEIISIDTVHGLNTIHKQNVFFNEKFKIVQPVYKEISAHFLQVGEQLTVRNRNIKLKSDGIVYIPIHKILQKHLSQDSFFESFNFSSESEESLLSSFRNGTRYKTHPIFSLNKRSVEIKFYYDETELCDALDSRAGKKHKLGFVYYQYGNRSVNHQGSLSSINLVAIAEYPIIKKYTFNPLAEMLVEDLKQVENGILLPNGEKICGGVSALSGDNQGVKFVWGFKESYSAEHPCQYCVVSLEEIHIMTRKDNQRLRSPSHMTNN